MIDLTDRRRRLQRAFRHLSPEPTIVRLSDWSQANPHATLSGGIRLMKTDKRFTIAETFVEPRNPRLHAFQYAILAQNGEALFRYECHPELQNATTYVRSPHFHPSGIHRDGELIQLHFPFTRAARESIAFAVIYWLRVDFLNRFGHAAKTAGSNPVKSIQPSSTLRS